MPRALTAAEVIEKLQACDPAAVVVVVGRSGFFEVATSVGQTGPDVHGVKNVHIVHGCAEEEEATEARSHEGTQVAEEATEARSHGATEVAAG